MNTPNLNRPNGSPASYMGRDFATWQAALNRQRSRPRTPVIVEPDLAQDQQS